MFDLESKTALVTGASRGIGAAIAKLLAMRGAKVVLAARNTEQLNNLQKELHEVGARATVLQMDIADPSAVQERLGTLSDDFSEIDILVNNAGVTADKLLARMSLEEWNRVIQTNLTGAFAVTKAVAQGMVKRRRGGRIVLVSSVVGLMGNAGQANYAASKAGLIGFGKSLARELGSRDITVNVVAPG